MTNTHCDLFPPNRTDDTETIVFGYIVGHSLTPRDALVSIHPQVRNTKLPRLRRQTLDVSKSISEAYFEEQWAIFPTLDCMIRYITELENLHLELDVKRITKRDIKEKILQTERSGKTDEEFVLLTRKGYNLPGISKPSIRLSLPVDPEILWVFESSRFERVVESWSTEDSDSAVVKEARDQLEAAAWLNALMSVKECEDWRDKGSLRPRFMQSLKPFNPPSFIPRTM